MVKGNLEREGCKADLATAHIKVGQAQESLDQGARKETAMHRY